MLAEFLLTPHAMTGDDGHNDASVIREMTNSLFPSRATPLALVCKLGGDDWVRITSRKIASIANDNLRHDAMALFQKILTLTCVSRPSVQPTTDDEASWIEAGTISSSQVPLSKIIVSRCSSLPSPLIASIKDFVSDEFWLPLSNPRLVGRETTSQEQVLRAICTHSDWLLMRLPQIRGSIDDEIVTVKQIIRLSTHLPDGFRKSNIDLHVCNPRNIPEHNLISGITRELRPLIQPEVKIQLSIWPEGTFVNRELLGGEYTRTSPGDLVRKSLWWLTMTHVAVGSRRSANAGEAGNTWSLFSREQADNQMKKISSATPNNVVDLR